MNYYIIFAALLVTMVITWALAALSKRPLKGLWLFFLIVFLATWAGQLWINPFGPTAWGIAWVPLVLVAVFFSSFVFALIPFKKREEGSSTFLIMGVFFWIIVVLLIAAISAGYYYKTPGLIAG